MSGGRGVGGNREVSPLFLLSLRGDLSGAGAEAIPKEGGTPWGKHGFPHASKSVSDAHAAGGYGRGGRSTFGNVASPASTSARARAQSSSSSTLNPSCPRVKNGATTR